MILNRKIAVIITIMLLFTIIPNTIYWDTFYDIPVNKSWNIKFNKKLDDPTWKNKVLANFYTEEITIDDQDMGIFQSQNYHRFKRCFF